MLPFCWSEWLKGHMVPTNSGINPARKKVKKLSVLICLLAENKRSKIWQKRTWLKPPSVIAHRKTVVQIHKVFSKRCRDKYLQGWVSHENNKRNQGLKQKKPWKGVNRKAWNQRIIRLERTSESLLVQPAAQNWSIQGRLLRLSSWVLSISQDVDSTASLDNLFQYLTTPQSTIFVAPCPFTIYFQEKSGYVFSTSPQCNSCCWQWNLPLAFISSGLTNQFPSVFLCPSHALALSSPWWTSTGLAPVYHCLPWHSPDAISKCKINTAGYTLANAA